MPLNADKLGEALRRIRLERDMTLQQVSDQTEVSVATLSRIERLEFDSVKSETLGALNAWIAKNQFEFREKRKLDTPDIVELHLRADKNLDKETADALSDLFRTVYNRLAATIKKKK
jgi:transcriptional regulator with XRE-family HTH domain